ncbi:MAG TPA: aromatic ring-hydroxylating dioxygenase subunit alpha [Pseudomonadales bacterium]|jgi:phenylpropionate dioxygenase-like ring-hydroxylating dioxygenase large terminal subunit
MKPVRNKPSYREIIQGDATPVADVLALTANPQQSTEDIPFEHYISDEFFEREMRKMWPKVWQIACREEHIPEVGDYFVYDIGRYSILVVRSAEDQIKAYHNSCLHRGTKLKPSGTAGFSEKLQCPFHGWTYQLDGTLEEVPCAWEFPHLDYEANRLPEVLAESWNGFVFINMDQDAQPLLQYLEVLPEHFASWRFDDWYVASHVRKELHCNWKVAMEGFMEAYHTPVVHPEMCQVVGDWNMQHDIFGDHVSRDLCPMGVSSPSLDEPLSEFELLRRARPGNPLTSETGSAELPDGKTARMVMAEETRRSFRDQFGMDLSDLSDAEVIDSLKYNVFPNLMFSGGAAIHGLSIFRPLGYDTNKCTIDRLTFLPVPKDGRRPPPAEVITIAEGESYATADTLNEFTAHVLDQDTSIMRLQQEGMHASAKGAETLSTYQESRVRWLHETLEKYLSR